MNTTRHTPAQSEQNADAFFNNLLSYRKPIASKEFIEQTLNRIGRQQKTRLFIITFFYLAGILSLTTIESLDWLMLPNITLDLTQDLTQLVSIGSDAIIGLVVGSMILLSVWLATSD